MNGEKFDKALKDNSKSYKALKAFIIKNLLKMQKEMVGDHTDVVMPDINTFLTDDMILQLLHSNVRMLYDFFDSQEIFVTVNVGWRYDIAGQQNGNYASRLEAEVEGFTEAFTILEKKL